VADPVNRALVSLAGRFDAAHALRADRCRVRGGGGRTILSPGPSSMPPSAVWNTIWPRTQYSTFLVAVLMPAVGIAGAVAPPVRAQALGTHPGCDLVFACPLCRHAARPQRQRPSQNLITAASVVCRCGN
jgi:hypothetical protein